MTKKSISLTKPLFLMGLLLILPIKNQAQESSLNCHQKVLLAHQLFSKKANKTKIINLLQSCANSGSPDAMHILANALLEGRPDEQNQNRAFRLIQRAAEQEHAEAACAVAYLYKKGIGCEQNLEKSLQWYTKSSLLDNDRANFMLGYFYFKGLGKAEQDYEKAVDYFNTSSFPLAKHWLAISYYYGYGVEQNQNKAIELLKDNNIPNSQTLLTQFIEEKNKEKINVPIVLSDIQITQNNNKMILNEAYVGEIIEYDYSGERVIKTTPIEVSFTSIKNARTINYIIKVNGQEKTGIAPIAGNLISFNDLKIQLTKTLQDNPNRSAIDFNIKSITLSKYKVNRKKYLIGEIEGSVLQWKEPTAPIKIVLQKSSKISNEVLKALDKQKGFIKLYPNPFVDDLLIQYSLKKSASVNVSVYDFQGKLKQSVVTEKTQGKGKQLHNIDGAALKKGYYIVKVSVDGTEHKKTIVKN